MPIFRVSPEIVDKLVKEKLGKRVSGKPDQIRVGPEPHWEPPTEPASDDLYEEDDDDQISEGENE
jgi:hypothetical protein